MTFCAFHSLDGVKAKFGTKFGENRSNGSEVVHVFVNLIIAAPPSSIPLFSNCWPILLFGITGSTLKQNLVIVAGTVQKLWCFVNC